MADPEGSPTSPDRAALREMLLFLADCGEDLALEEAGIDRLAKPEPAAKAPVKVARDPAPSPARQSPGMQEPAAQTRPPPFPAVPDEAQALRARALARQAASLEELREIMAGFDGCNLKSTAKNLVFADGNPAAALMLVGEAPGREEDLEGRPFVGRSGQLLDRILAAIGRDRTSVYIANTVPWRPPGNREPSPMEAEICRPFIERQIELAAPKVLITLGNPSTKLLLHTTAGITRLRGNWQTHTTPSGMAIPTMPTLHPAYLLRNPAHKKLAWRDFLDVKAKLRELG